MKIRVREKNSEFQVYQIVDGKINVLGEFPTKYYAYQFRSKHVPQKCYRPRYSGEISSINDLLASFRYNKKLKYKDLSKLTNVKISTLKNIETGYTHLSYSVFKVLKKIYGKEFLL